MTRYEFLAQKEKEVHDYLKSNGIFADVYTHNLIPVVSVEISWGDWKHEHWACKDLMKKKGFKYVGSQVTEKAGPDCYSATHNFIMTDEMAAAFKSINE